MNKENKLDVVIENIPFGVCLRDLEGKILHYNKQFLELFDIKDQEIYKSHIQDIVDREYINYMDEIEHEMMQEKKHIVSEYVMDTLKGKKILEVNKAPIIDLSNQVIGMITLFRDVTDSRSKEKEVTKLAYTDWLTNLFNRRGLYSYIECERRKSHFDLTVMFIDLDNFKRLNDSCGHYYGDEALVCLANKLKSTCTDAFIARVGGDEFVVVWKNLNTREAIEQRADQLLNVMQTEFCTKDKLSIVSASIGIVQGNTEEDDINSLLVKGDLALYKAKEKGKNQYVFYTDQLEQERILRLQIEEDLQEIIKKNEIMLHYQPQYSVKGELKAFEALFRWNNEKYTHMPVIEVIKIIEESSLIDIIGDCIIREACQFAKRINENRADKILVFVNLSAMQIMNPGFIKRIDMILKEVGVLPACIGIEITESILLEDVELSIEKIQKLRDRGISIALDDFGAGCSSFNYLVQLPLSQVKIDQSFVRQIGESEQYNKLVKLMIDGAHSLELPVVAEGVETREEFELLKQMNIDYLQGYLFSKPLPEKEAIQLTKKILRE